MKSLKHCTEAIQRRLYVNQVVYLLDLKEAIQVTSPAEVRRATPENIEDLKAFQTSTQVDQFKGFLARGEHGYLGYLDGRCVHRNWVREAPLEAELYPGYSVPLEEDEAFLHYGETAPEARGKNIQPGVVYRMVKDFSHKRRIFTAINRENTSSLKGVKKAGFRVVQQLHLVRVLGLTLKAAVTPFEEETAS